MTENGLRNLGAGIVSPIDIYRVQTPIRLEEVHPLLAVSDRELPGPGEQHTVGLDRADPFLMMPCWKAVWRYFNRIGLQRWLYEYEVYGLMCGGPSPR